MKNLNRAVPVFLFAISAFCLIVGAGFFIWEHTNEQEETPASVSVSVTSTVSKTVGPIASASSVTSATVENKEPEASIEIKEPEISAEPEPEPEPEPEIIIVENPYKEYFLENTDMIAWIKIPDTEIDFPVMWTPADENYYLYKGFDKNYSRYGLPILDTDSSMYPSSTNLIIHGHNIKNSTFYFLLQYKNESYFNEHPYIHLYGKDKDHVYQVMAVFRSKVYYTTDTCFKYYKFFNASSNEEFKDFYDNVKDMALYDTGVTAEFGDTFLTLSTCSSHTENGRFVVVAKEIESGDEYMDPFAESEPQETN